jgi:hypothetical protein
VAQIRRSFAFILVRLLGRQTPLRRYPGEQISRAKKLGADLNLLPFGSKILKACPDSQVLAKEVDKGKQCLRQVIKTQFL